MQPLPMAGALRRPLRSNRVANITKLQRRRLKDAGITTMVLAESSRRVPRMQPESGPVVARSRSWSALAKDMVTYDRI
jgi:hypothetical protein